MMTQTNVAVVTIVRDDDVMLTRFVDYYGGLFGRDALYIINHGNEASVHEIAQGCNIIPVPAIETDKFTMLHWRTKNHLLSALRQWFSHVIVCDVDEFIVVDPDSGHDLRSWLMQAPARTVYSAMGLDIVHLRDRETAPIEEGILGPRRFTQVALHYSKPCIVSKPAKLSRGGHYSTHPTLNMPDFLYLFHMKYCDSDLFRDTADRRNFFADRQRDLAGQDLMTNPKWLAENRNDTAQFDALLERPIVQGFDFTQIRAAMATSWRRRNEEFWHFDRPDYEALYELPERFFGLDTQARAAQDKCRTA